MSSKAPPSQQPLRVGILGHEFVAWAGGLDYLRLMCSCLNASGADVELHFLLPDRGPWVSAQRGALQVQRLLRHLTGRPPGQSHAPSRAIIMDSIAHSVGAVQVHRIDIGSAALARAGRRLGIDVVLPAISPVPHRTGIPWVAHVYDFQHHHLSHYFSERDIRVRDENFGRLLDHAPVVIFNSAAVIADSRRLRPNPAARILQLPLCAAPVDGWFDIDVAQAQAAHGLHRPYFIVCNQFWLHKDHRTAFEAFAKVAAKLRNVELVCTGATSDPRNPHHLKELVELLTARGVEGRVHILGLISKQDQIALLRGSLALVQPTLSEGTPGGLASYDAVALGVPVLLSDIPVNLELREPDTAFFRAGDADDLARVMLERLLVGTAPTLPRGELVRRGHARRAAFGQALLEAIALARA